MTANNTMRHSTASNRFTAIPLHLVLACAGALTLSLERPVTTLTAPRAAAPVEVPLAFEQNAGQHDAAIRYAARGQGYAVSMLDSGVAIALRSNEAQASRVVMKFGGTRTPSLSAEAPLQGRANYFVGRNPRGWRTSIPMSARVRYKDAFDGVDVVFYGRGGRLEYDVVVAPGADPRVARFLFDGADAIRVKEDGTLALSVADRELQYSKPVAYQQIGNSRQPVPVEYRHQNDAVMFDVGSYDPAYELVIDPVLEFATYLGGSGNDVIKGVAVDAAGSTYVTGATDSTDFPVSSGPLQPSRKGHQDVFVTKLSRDGAIVYSTYIGGTNGAAGQSIDVDASGAAYVVGATDSADFPTTLGAYQRTYRGGENDLMVLKLSPAGNRLVYSTYLGGTGTDGGTSEDIVVDPIGYATVVGSTESGDFPTTGGAVMTTHPAGSVVGFATKLTLTGSGLIFSTLLTGTSEQYANDVTLDSLGRPVITGSVEGSMRATTQMGPLGGVDAYVMKLNATGTSIVFSTRVGGTNVDFANGVALDAVDDSPHIAGTTYSTDFPVSRGQFFKGRSDAFVMRFSPDGMFRSYGTLIGGSDEDTGTAVAVNTHYVTVFGDTLSADFPVVGSVQPYRGNRDAFVTRFNYGQTMLFSSLVGGSRLERTASGAVDGAGASTVVAETTSSDAPVARAAQPTNHGASDSFIARVGVVPRGTAGPNDVVVHVADVATLYGNWEKVADAGAASGFRLHNPDRGAPKLTSALATPADYFEFTVDGLTNGPYMVWVRGKADGNSYSNDSVYIQFSNGRNAQDEADNERDFFRIGTSEGLPISIEDCSNCGLQGWGWQDGGYGKRLPGPWLYFTNGQPTTVRVQRREDGVSIDQIVIARQDHGAGPHFYTAPGYQKDDDTIIPPQNASGIGGAADDVVIYPADEDSTTLAGSWMKVPDSTAAAGARLHNPDAGAPKVQAPLASPAHYFEVEFTARANVPYRLWIRGRADADYYGNDSAYVQFSDSVDGAGTPTWRIGSTAATTYVLEDCSGCGLAGWGWNDNAYGTGALGPLVFFQTDGTHRLRIQSREDGLSIDQIVLSPHNYIDTAPGRTKNDTTIVMRPAP